PELALRRPQGGHLPAGIPVGQRVVVDQGVAHALIPLLGKSALRRAGRKTQPDAVSFLSDPSCPFRTHPFCRLSSGRRTPRGPARPLSGGLTMLQRYVPVVLGGLLAVALWAGFTSTAHAQNAPLNRFYYYPYTYFPHNYWPTIG